MDNLKIIKDLPVISKSYIRAKGFPLVGVGGA